jgi:uncharacterized membrane protein YbhN (UPF0104 family)/tRNA A-37 threonylcarbamoyl transferase component Bud32
MKGAPGPTVLLTRAKRSWLGSVFGTVPVHPTRRTIGHAARVVIAIAGIAFTLRSTPELSALDDVVLTAVTDLGSGLDPFLRSVFWAALALLGTAIVVAALLTRRWRLFLGTAVAAGIAALGGAYLHTVVDLPSAGAITDAGAAWPGGDPTIPVWALTVASAIAFGALPFLMRPTRRLVVGALLVGAICGTYVLESLPSAMVASVLVGWGAAALAHLALGAPEGGPGVHDVGLALADLDIDVTDLVPVDDDAAARHFAAHTSTGEELVVVVVGRDATRSQYWRGLVRRLWYKEHDSAIGWSRLAQIEHQTLLLLLAERGGVTVPRLVASGTAGAIGDAVLVTARPPGPTLEELDPTQVTDGVLDDIWANVGRLHDAGIVHGDLRAANVVVGDDGDTALMGFGRAEPVSSGARPDTDDAALLVTTAAIVGADRAVAAFQLVRGPDALTELLPVLEPAALPPAVRRSVEGARPLAKALREVAAADLGIQPPELEELRRVSPGTIAMALGALFGVYLIAGELSEAGGLRSILEGATGGWVVVVALLSQMPQLAQAIAMLGSVVRPIPLGPATGVQFANQFMGLIGGTVATTALVIRFFQRLGLGAALAVSSAVVNTLAVMITQTILVVAGIVVTWGDWQLPGTASGSGSTSSSSGNTLLTIIVGVAVVSAAALFVPRLRRKVTDRLRPHVKVATQNLRDLRGQPIKQLQLFGGNTVSQLLFALTLGAALLAYGESLPLLQLVIINSFASLLGGILPVPGGLGVIEAGMIAGMVAAGIPQEQATAATFTARLFTCYLPPIWGWFSLRWLTQKEYI